MVSNIESRLSARHKTCFFWAAHRSAAQHAGKRRFVKQWSAFQANFRFARAGWLFLIRSLSRAYFIAAIASEPPGAGVDQKPWSRCPVPFQTPLHPESNDRALHARKRGGTTTHRACACAAKAHKGQPYGQVKTADNMACLRGVATGGAEKEKDLEPTENDLEMT